MRITLAAVTAGALALLGACQPANPPDLIIYGGAVHTGVDGQAPAEAVSIRGGRIVAVGAMDDLIEDFGGHTRLLDLKGAHLYPGFTDAHVHLRGVGERETTLDLDEIASIAQLTDAVSKAASAATDSRTLIGRGWIETHWPEARFPTRQDIDAVTGERPALLTRADGHALLANSAALEKAGLLVANPAQPDGGRIELDADGMPTGMLIDNAMGLVASLSGPASEAEIAEAYELGAKRYASLGWTGGHNMSVPAADIALINTLSDEGRLPLRIYNAVDGEDPEAFSVMGASDGALVTTRAIKLYMDGALGSRGALLADPYADRPGETGLQLARPQQTMDTLRRAYLESVQVCFHAIGDLGNTLVLDWMEKTFRENDSEAGEDLRWRIEHAQIIDPDDIPRFAELGIIPSMQPSHAIGDLYFAPDRLGDQRLDGAYAWRALIDSGAIIAGGSDAPVEQGDPRIEFYAAIARKDLRGASGDNWRPDQKVTREEALKMFTLWPAYASFREDVLGTIEAGKLADLTAFDEDILTIPELDILTVEPVLTVVGGAVVFESPDQD